MDVKAHLEQGAADKHASICIQTQDMDSYHA